ncbi:hypothetical protein GCM10007916_18840 [Psychromonas marina]|uniref:Uncharacterized protein n=1 Tax=Psychromonas marina TaxID=88364 RepID=A0ABQ6E057_9GAMM|nr:hypothetical protein GCM10007916_18840 [Psychromonas marina]
MQEIVVLTSKLTTQLGIILTSKNDHFINSFGINRTKLPDDAAAVSSGGLDAERILSIKRDQ